MLRLIPLDVWAATALAVAIALIAIFDPIPAIFVSVSLGVLAYVVVEAFGDKLS